MFINEKSQGRKELYICNNKIADFIQKSYPIYSLKNGEYMFLKSKLLEKILKSAPLSIKIQMSLFYPYRGGDNY